MQTKSSSGEQLDEYEKEADRVAAQAMQMPDPPVRRPCACGGGCPTCVGADAASQRSGMRISRLNRPQTSNAVFPEAVHDTLRSAGHPLDRNTREFFETRLGHDLSQVRLHSDATAERAARSINAKAFAAGTHIVLDSAGHSPSSRDGQLLLAHELTHVVQQSAVSPRSPSSRYAGPVQRTPQEAEALVDRNTSWGNLDEAALGAEMLRLALSGQVALAAEVLDALGSTDRDDVAYEFMLAATETQLTSLGATAARRPLLHRVFDELTSGSVAAEEQEQADRILRVTTQQTVAVSAFDAAATSRETKIFPFRLPGFTVFSDAPIEARRERGGVWAHSFVRVLGTDEFRGETRTLPTEYFLGGIVLPETEVIGVRLYDSGGTIVYTTPLFLIQLANATDFQVLQKVIEAAGIGVTLGAGSLAGLGIEATMTARVLLWADRAAFALGTITSVLREHRAWLVEHFGAGFMDVVDALNSVVAIYGLARVVFQAPRLIQGLREGYRSFVTAARGEAGLSSAEQGTVSQVTQNTDRLIEQIEQIEATRPGQAAAPETTTVPRPAETAPVESAPAETAPTRPPPAAAAGWRSFVQSDAGGARGLRRARVEISRRARSASGGHGAASRSGGRRTIHLEPANDRDRTGRTQRGGSHRYDVARGVARAHSSTHRLHERAPAGVVAAHDASSTRRDRLVFHRWIGTGHSITNRRRPPRWNHAHARRTGARTRFARRCRDGGVRPARRRGGGRRHLGGNSDHHGDSGERCVHSNPACACSVKFGG